VAAAIHGLDHATPLHRESIVVVVSAALYLGVAGLAAGTVALAGHPDAHGPEPWLFAGAAALAGAWPHYAIALATAALPSLFAGDGVVPACAAAAAVQVAVSVRRRAVEIAGRLG
jgi:hypothetical protein